MGDVATLPRMKPDSKPVELGGFNELKWCRSGPMLYNKHDIFIGRSMQKYGEFSWSEVEVFAQVAKPGTVVIDAGANIGTHTVELSRMAGFVMAFEPQRLVFHTLCANVALNNRTNVRCFHAALGAKNGTITVPVWDQDKEHNFGGMVLEGVTQGEPVELMALDRFTIQNLSFIKADIEGMERDMLIGAEKTVARHRPIMYLETDGMHSKETREILFDWKYRCYWHIAYLFNENNFFEDPENIFMVNGSAIVSTNMLCIPGESDIQIMNMMAVASSEETTAEMMKRD